MKKEKQININWQIVGVLAAIVVIIIVTGIIRPQFFKLSNIANVVRQNAAQQQPWLPVRLHNYWEVRRNRF